MPASLRSGPTSISSSHTIYTLGLLLGALISVPRVPELCSFDFDLGERSCHMGRVVATTSETSPSVFPPALYFNSPSSKSCSPSTIYYISLPSKGIAHPQ